MNKEEFNERVSAVSMALRNNLLTVNEARTLLLLGQSELEDPTEAALWLDRRYGYSRMEAMNNARVKLMTESMMLTPLPKLIIEDIDGNEAIEPEVKAAGNAMAHNAGQAMDLVLGGLDVPVPDLLTDANAGLWNQVMEHILTSTTKQAVTASEPPRPLEVPVLNLNTKRRIQLDDGR